MVRWGIAGCGEISNDFTLALTSLPKEEHKVIDITKGQYITKG